MSQEYDINKQKWDEDSEHSPHFLIDVVGHINEIKSYIDSKYNDDVSTWSNFQGLFQFKFKLIQLDNSISPHAEKHTVAITSGFDIRIPVVIDMI